MSRDIFRSMLWSLAFAIVLARLTASAQQTASSAGNADGGISAFASAARASSQTAGQPTPNPFERPWTTSQVRSSDSEASDSLSLQRFGKWSSASVTETFAAPPGFYAPDHGDPSAADWNHGMGSEVAAYLGRTGTASIRMTTDFEVYGQRRQALATGAPGSQTFTMEWQAAKLVSSKLGLLEIAAGEYQQQVVARPSFANGPLTDELLAYEASFAGLEGSVALPDKNATFLLRYGAEHLGPAFGKPHVLTFEFSWTW